MPSITIGLPECGFLEDLPDVTFTDITAAAYVTVKLDNVTLLSNIRLTPDKQNRIVIYARPMIRSWRADKTCGVRDAHTNASSATAHRIDNLFDGRRRHSGRNW
ncbi:MAG: hypothetical protein V8Q54_07205 [Alistipes senegalensis]